MKEKTNKNFFEDRIEKLKESFEKRYDNHVKSRNALRGLSFGERFWKSAPTLSAYRKALNKIFGQDTLKGKVLSGIAIILFPLTFIGFIIYFINKKYQQWQNLESNQKKILYGALAAIFLLTLIAMQLAMIPSLPATIAVGLALSGMIPHFGGGAINITLFDGMPSVLFLGKDLFATHKDLQPNEKSFRRWSAFSRLLLLGGGIAVGVIFIAPLVPALITVSLPAWAGFLVIFMKIMVPVIVGMLASSLFAFIAVEPLLNEIYPPEQKDNKISQSFDSQTSNTSENSKSHSSSEQKNSTHTNSIDISPSYPVTSSTTASGQGESVAGLLAVVGSFSQRASAVLTGEAEVLPAGDELDLAPSSP